MAICLLGPAYALGQTNAEILLAAENDLRGCVAYQNTAAASGTCTTRPEHCFEDVTEYNSTGKWVTAVYLSPKNSGPAIWWVGDSRMVGMWAYKVIKVTDNNEDDNNALIAKGGAGYHWFNNTALGKLTSCLCDGDTVILAMGANDVSTPYIAIRNYTGAYQNLIQDYSNVNFYVLSVNPVRSDIDNYRYDIKNDQITAFNNGMFVAFSQRYINTYDAVWDELRRRTNCTDDGVHYNNGCGIEQKVYDTVMNAIHQ